MQTFNGRGKESRHTVKKNCTKENCNAYVCGGTRAYITAERAAEHARRGYEDMRGYDPYDVYTERDFSESTLAELIEIEKERII